MLDFLRQRRNELDAWLTDRGKAHTFSLTSYSVHEGVTGLVAAHVSGRCLDAGSGRAPYKAELRARGVEVVSIDIQDRGGGIDHIADIQDMPVIASESMDSVICTEVLEHVPRPRDALRELARVLKPGGMLVLSVPHLSPIHEAPHDYFRYTRYGLRSLLESAGFEVVQMDAKGGLFAFLSHGVSAAFFSGLGAIRVTRPLVWGLNYFFLVRVLGALDDAVGLKQLYPANYVVLARKRAGAPPAGAH